MGLYCNVQTLRGVCAVRGIEVCTKKTYNGITSFGGGTMSEITRFVKAIFESYERLFSDTEEDQKLPSKKTLEEVCETLFNVSCMREEGRFPSFRVCFINPESTFLDAYIYAHVLLFKSPIPFNTRELNKLAPALNAHMSYLLLDTNKKPFKMVGVIASYTAWEKIITRELTMGNRMPRIPNIFVNGPGELKACFGEATIVSYNSGHCFFYRTDTFTSTLVADELANGSNVSENERLQLLYRIIWKVSNYNHGGAILIVPSEEACADYIDIKYQLASGFLFRKENGHEKPSGKARDKEIITYADLIAKLTSVDGSVILTKDFDLLGFGAETLMDKMEDKHPDMCFIKYDGREDTTKHFKDHGMRHRAGYRFCSAVEGSVAFIISSDGSIEACTKHDNKVVVYDNVALPLL